MIITTVRTTLGEQISAYSQANSIPITFNNFSVGDGLNPGTLKAMTDMIAAWKTFSVSSVERTPDGKARVRGAFDNSALTSDKNIREIGLFATCGTFSGLYAYGYAISGDSNYTEVMPRLGAGGFTRRVIDFVVDAANVADADYTVYEESVSPEDFDELSSEIGTVSTITGIADGVTYPKTVAGVMQKIYDLVTGILSMFTGGVLNIANGGTGASTAAGARTSLGITPAAIGASPSDHTHNWTEATQSAPGLMSAADKTKLDGMNYVEWFRTVVAEKSACKDTAVPWCAYGSNIYSLDIEAGITLFDKTTSTKQGAFTSADDVPRCICSDGVRIYAPLFSRALMIVYTIATKAYSFYTLPGTGAYACCTDGTRVYIRSASKLYVFTISNGATESANLTSFSGDDGRGICTDGTKVYIASGLNIDIYIIATKAVTPVYNEGDYCSDCCNDTDYVYFACESVLKKLYKANNGLTTINLGITGPFTSCRVSGASVYVLSSYATENVKFVARVNKTTGAVSPVYGIRRALVGKLFEVINDTLYFIDHSEGGTNYVYGHSVRTGRVYSSNGLKIVTFALYGAENKEAQAYAEDKLVFPGCFAASCLYTAAAAPSVDKLPIALSKDYATFNITKAVEHTGFAVGI